jgi:predicted enzyme related to lactoylglutathione lyase
MRDATAAIFTSPASTARSGIRTAPSFPDMFDAYFWVDDVEALHAEVTDRGAEIVHGPIDQGYGLREFRVRDPDGYILAFGRPL